MNTAKKHALIVRSPLGEARTYPLNHALGKGGLRIAAVADARYELIDLASGFAPDTLRVMRKGQHLLVFFDGEALERLTIEDHYASQPSSASMLVGKSEAGDYHAFVPETAAMSDTVALLADTPTPHGMALGGGILPSLVPVQAGAADGAASASLLGYWPLLGGLAALGLVVAASKDKGAADQGPKSNAEAGLTLTLLTDANNDGWLNLSEIGNASTTQVRASFDGSKVRAGDQLQLSASNADSALPTQTHILSAQNVRDGHVDLVLTRPQEGQSQRVQVNFFNQTTGAATDAMPSDVAKLDTLAIGFSIGSYSADGNNLVSQITFNPSAVETGRYSLNVGLSNFAGVLSASALPGDPKHQLQQNFLSVQTTAQGKDVYLDLWDAAGNASARAYAFSPALDNVLFTFNNSSFFVI